MWNSLLQGPASAPDPALNPPQIGGKETPANLPDHFYFEGRTDFYRYDTSFNTGVPTITGIIDEPSTGTFNPAGYPDPAVFQPSANRYETLLDMGTQGFGSDRVDTHFTLRQEQDLTAVYPGAPAQDILETFPGNREYQVLDASVDIHGKPSDGYWSGLDMQIGRINIYGAELASLDGAAITLNRPRFKVTAYAGRRFTYFSEPGPRAIGGANVEYRLSRDTSLEYDGLWYIKGSHNFGVRKRIGNAWLWTTYLRVVGGSPTNVNSQVMYAPINGKTSLRVSFAEELSANDYAFDYTEVATDHDSYNVLPALNIGTLAEFSQFMIDARRTLTERFRVGGSVWVRRLLNDKDDGPFDVSFTDYRINTQIFPLRKTEMFYEYHQHSSDRLNPSDSTMLDDITVAGETSIKDLSGEIRQTFGEGRFGLNGGLYYRRVSLQDQFYILNGLHQSGWLAGAWWKLNSKERLFFDYDLDNDFALFTPDIKNARALHVGVAWKY
ncbi:MAG TPA: hypothetical protein VME17_18870 [Bryobacteraceae bacterium]|nr:hypothetical protein [Bryobacteraceae bacterium]